MFADTCVIDRSLYTFGYWRPWVAEILSNHRLGIVLILITGSSSGRQSSTIPNKLCMAGASVSKT